MTIRLAINGEEVEVDIAPRVSLVDCLRDSLLLTGTHVGCEHGVCGSCTVLFDGEPVRACLMSAHQAQGHEVTTIEGITPPGGLSALQQSFRRHSALQCGFCTPGMLMSAHALLKSEPDASEARIREVLSGNLCRCTGYTQIVDAVVDARDLLHGESA